jgi:3-dehydroquinate dehydratase-2
MKILILNGPNLNLLGTREPEIYGKEGFDSYLKTLREQFSSIQIDYFQSNVEGELINKLHEVGFSYTGIIFNAGAYTHTSIAIGDAIKAITTPLVEVHLSNVFARESYRHESFLTPVCKGCISGFGLQSYQLALQSFL